MGAGEGFEPSSHLALSKMYFNHNKLPLAYGEKDIYQST